ncbi:MAG: diadenylate cyclase CdaA [Bacilli bacterium]|nr:diadenylate cyclase CdaA [Bacilli bacterium]
MLTFDEIIEAIRKYTEDFKIVGFVRLGLDLLLIAVVLFIIFKIMRTRAHGIRIFVVVIGAIFLYVFSLVFKLNMFTEVLDYVYFWSLGALFIVYSNEIRHFLDYFFTPVKTSAAFANKEEKQEIISTLVSTSEFLSRRRVGALITIEREDSLNTFIDKAILINGNVSQELLTTIFTPGTAAHDGAVIIRKSKIMCAAAYFPSTDRYDVPKSLGTRHRAAIGISEKTDSLTIVVSEETGYISVAIDGIININLSLERLEEMLDRYLTNK